MNKTNKTLYTLSLYIKVGEHRPNKQVNSVLGGDKCYDCVIH